jgi:hypothetical protein
MVKVFGALVEATIAMTQHLSLIIVFYPMVMVKRAVIHHCCKGRKDKEGKRRKKKRNEG